MRGKTHRDHGNNDGDDGVDVNDSDDGHIDLGGSVNAGVGGSLDVGNRASRVDLAV